MRIERRGRQPHQEFAMVPNATARDKALSFRSRGILALLLSHDEGFNITADGVAKEGTEGRDAVRTSFKELEAAGYIRRTKVRDAATGRLAGKVYLYPYGDAPVIDPDVTVEEQDEEPSDEAAESATSTDDSPGTDSQSSGNQSQADQSYKEDHQENQDAAAVSNQATEQQQQMDKPAETMEEAVGIIAETLGGTVTADVSHGETPGLPQHDPDGPRAQHHGGNRYTVAEDPRMQKPFPMVAYNSLAFWQPTQQEGAGWEAAWQTADMTSGRGVVGDEFYYDPEIHLMIYLSRCRSEGRRPRGDLWLRFFIEDRAKHIQTLKQQREQAERRAEDPQEREERSNHQLPPANWGVPEEG